MKNLLRRWLGIERLESSVNYIYKELRYSDGAKPQHYLSFMQHGFERLEELDKKVSALDALGCKKGLFGHKLQKWDALLDYLGVSWEITERTEGFKKNKNHPNKKTI